MDIDLFNEPLGTGKDGKAVYLKDVWPSASEVAKVVESSIESEMYRSGYADLFAGDERCRELSTPEGAIFDWKADSTYVRQPPYFKGMPRNPEPVSHITGARVLAKMGVSVTPNHLTPPGAITNVHPTASQLTPH